MGALEPATRVGSQVHLLLWVQVADPGKLIITTIITITSSSGVAVDIDEAGDP